MLCYKLQVWINDFLPITGVNNLVGGMLVVHQESPDSEILQRKPKIIAAIPCFNEEMFIGSVVLKSKRYVDRVVVIDDGSTDATARVAREAGATVYRNKQNQGYGAAIRSAIAKGQNLRADILVILDGDGQHDPKDIPKLVKPLINGTADISVGSRFIGKGEKPPLYRRLGQRVLTMTTNVGSGQRISDSQSGFRAYSKKTLKELNLTESGMSVSSEIQFAVSRSGLRVAEVPITTSYSEKAKRNPVGHGAGVLNRLAVLVTLRKPILILGIPGIGFLGGGLFLGIRVLIRYSEVRELAIGNAFGAVLLSLAGLLALFTLLMLQSMKELMRGEVTRLAQETRGYTLGEEDSHSDDGS